jgi:predicted dehydrogenase
MTRIKWGLIGAGDIARKRVAPALRDLPNCTLVSVSRSRYELAQSFAQEFGAHKWSADWREIVADRETDAVYIATPVYLHAEQAIAAAEAGKHVLCEKPMALNVNECDQMIAACDANNVKLGIAYYRRFYPVIERVKQIVFEGEIGKVAVAQINAFEFFDPSRDDSRHWLIEREKSGGGPMMDFGCHRLEVFVNLFGGVSSIESVVSGAIFGREVEDTSAAVLHFENGTCATLTVTHAAIEPRDTLDIYGSNGSIHIPALNTGDVIIKVGKTETRESHTPVANVHGPLIADFADAVLRDREPTISGKIGREISALIEEIYANRM